jgi:alkaline phosphatase D
MVRFTCINDPNYQASWGNLLLNRRRFLQGTIAAAGAVSSFASLLFADDGISTLDQLVSRPLRRLAFGSCNRSLSSQSHWKIIGQKQPDLWIWLGDNIYADHMLMEQRVALYDRLFYDDYYREFRNRVPIVGIWDDHDYAHDNCDGSFGEKEESKKALLDFLQVPINHPTRSQPGVYQSYVIGPRGQRTHVVLLDLRFNMDRSKREKTLLGDMQWAWLEQELRASDADLLVVGSSLNLTSPITGFGIEGWNSFGAEKARFYDLLAQVGKPTLVLSGDRHFAEMAQVELPGGLKVYEAMSSGMTHSLGMHLPHKGRIGRTIGWRNYGLIEIDWATTGPILKSSICATISSETYEQAILRW